SATFERNTIYRDVVFIRRRQSKCEIAMFVLEYVDAINDRPQRVSLVDPVADQVDLVIDDVGTSLKQNFVTALAGLVDSSPNVGGVCGCNAGWRCYRHVRQHPA